MALDERFVTSVNLEPYFVDKSTGLPLANGTVEFWQDDDRGTPKLVYQLSGSPPNYTYTALPNPLTLSAVGTFQNAGGDNIAVYYFPYDGDPDSSNGNVELYYIVVKDENGVLQFTREAWPNLSDANSPINNDGGNTSNEISNSQFVDVLFDPSATLQISFNGASTTTVNIAPDWRLEIVHTGNGTVDIIRNSIIGQSRLPNNPPYTITFIAGVNITSLRIIQRLDHNPDIFAPTVNGVAGYISGSLLLKPASSAEMIYSPSVGTDQVILNVANATADYVQYDNTIQLDLADNTDNSNVGYVDIIIALAISGETTLGNIQIVGLDSNQQDVGYIQNTVSRQEDFLFHYYNPILQYKETPSYLIGWDFPLNPAQPLGDTVAASAIGANKSKYVWDQTIVFQSTDSGVGVTRATSGALVTTAAATTQMALIQYLPQIEARKILNDSCSVNISALTSVVAGVQCRVSLWYTTDANLPNIAAGTNDSIVLSLDATGIVTPAAGNWTQVTRNNLGDSPSFTIATSSTTNFNDYSFSGFNINGIAGASTATFFAIVISTSSVTMGETISWNSISLVPGDIPCRPAPQTMSQVLLDCKRYYNKSFLTGIVPATQIVDGMYSMPQTAGASLVSFGPVVFFAVEMRDTPNVVLYNPVSNNAQIRNTGGAPGDWSLSAASNIDATGFDTTGVTNGGSSIGNTASVQWTADARLGIV